ncbi:hypothetical protein pb186bvf_008130 [Paramecium bursaria]
MYQIILIICTLTLTIQEQQDKLNDNIQLETLQLLDQEIQSEDQITQNYENDDYDEHKNKLLKFINWVFQHGAEANHISIDHSNKINRIVKASQQIQEEERILLIPRKLMWISTEVKKNLLYSELLLNQDQLIYPTHTFLALQILYEKQNPISQWKDFLDILPEKYDTFPIYYDQSVLDYLEGSYLLNDIENQKKDLLKDYQTVLKYAPQFEIISYEQFVQANIMTCSRVFSLNIDGVEVEAFVPLADFFNYDKNYQTHWGFSEQDQGYFLDSEQIIEEDEEIFSNYGDKDNHIFLLNYGFVNKDSSQQSCYFRFTLQEDFPYLNEKVGLIYKWYSKGVGQQFSFQISKDLSHVIVVNFIDLIRYILEPNLGVIYNYPVNDTIIYSKENEQQVWEHILNITQAQKGLYKYSEVDVQDLMLNQTNINILNCLQILQEEYEVLNFFIDLAQDSIQILSQIPKQRDLESYQDKYNPYYQKIQHLFKQVNDDL